MKQTSDKLITKPVIETFPDNWALFPVHHSHLNTRARHTSANVIETSMKQSFDKPIINSVTEIFPDNQAASRGSESPQHQSDTPLRRTCVALHGRAGESRRRSRISSRQALGALARHYDNAKSIKKKVEENNTTAVLVFVSVPAADASDEVHSRETLCIPPSRHTFPPCTWAHAQARRVSKHATRTGTRHTTAAAPGT